MDRQNNTESMAEDLKAMLGEPQSRELEFVRDAVDEENRTVELALSSEGAEVERSWGIEILAHDTESIDLARASQGLPLLVNHDTGQMPVGRLLPDSFRIGADKVLRATAKISQNAEALWRDIQDGIASSVSIGYRIMNVERQEDEEARDGVPVFRVTRWQPYEASLVSVPADFVGAGVGRQLDESQPTNQPTKPLTATAPEATPEKIQVSDKTELTAEEVRKSEIDRIRDIEALGDSHGETKLAREYAMMGKTVSDFRQALLEVLKDKPATQADALGMDNKEAKQYSFMRVINALANPTNARAQEDAAFEFEASRAVADVLGKNPQGIFVPGDVQARTMTSGTATAGGNTVATDLLADSFIDRLEKAMLTAQLGTILRGLSGDCAIPRNSGTNTAGWISAEGSDSAESEASFAQVTLSPNTVGGYTDVSRRLLLQSSMDIEGFVRNDLATSIGQAMDLAALGGTGSSGQPTGITETSGVNEADVAAGGVPTWAELVSFETAVAADDALQGRLAYMVTAAIAGSMKTTSKDDGSGQFLLDGAIANGREVFVSNNLESGQIIFGNWSDLLIGFFGGLDINVDTATGSRAGTVRIVALQDADIAVRNAVSFCKANNTG